MKRKTTIIGEQDEKELKIDKGLISRNKAENNHPHITGSRKLFMSNPSDNLDVTKGATLRDNASVVIKYGGPIDLEDLSMG